MRAAPLFGRSLALVRYDATEHGIRVSPAWYPSTTCWQTACWFYRTTTESQSQSLVFGLFACFPPRNDEMLFSRSSCEFTGLRKLGAVSFVGWRHPFLLFQGITGHERLVSMGLDALDRDLASLGPWATRSTHTHTHHTRTHRGRWALVRTLSGWRKDKLICIAEAANDRRWQQT